MNNPNSTQEWTAIFTHFDHDAVTSVFNHVQRYMVQDYMASVPAYNTCYSPAIIQIESVAQKSQKVSENAIGDDSSDDDDALTKQPSRPRYVQKNFKSFDYGFQLKNGLKDEERALGTLQALLPDYHVLVGPKYKHDAELIHKTTGQTVRVEIKTCHFVHRTGQIFDEIHTENKNGIHLGGSEKALSDGCLLYVVQSFKTGELYIFEAQNVFNTRSRILREDNPALIKVSGENRARSLGITLHVSELDRIDDVSAFLAGRI